jgi:hypothetical protein
MAEAVPQPRQPIQLAPGITFIPPIDLTPELGPEIWRIIGVPGYTKYAVSTKGRIFNLSTGKLISGSDRHGYIIHSLMDDTGDKHSMGAHKIVAYTFHGLPKDDETADHINKKPADNNFLNIRWASRSVQNKNRNKYKVKVGHRMCQLDENSGALIKVWHTMTSAGEFYNVNSGRLTEACQDHSIIVAGFKWMYASDYYFDKTEIWKPVPHPTLNKVEASNNGQIMHNGMVMAGNETPAGYLTVGIYCQVEKRVLTLKVHRLVCAAFLGPSDLLVNHIDGKKGHDHIDNLEYVTPGGNVRHSLLPHMPAGKKLKPVVQLDKDENFIAIFRYAREAAVTLKITIKAVTGACHSKGFSAGFKWRYLVDMPPEKLPSPLPPFVVVDTPFPEHQSTSVPALTSPSPVPPPIPASILLSPPITTAPLPPPVAIDPFTLPPPPTFEEFLRLQPK